MLNFKVFQVTLMKYNFWHYGLRSNELLCKKVGISTKYIDYEEILGISYKEFGLTGLIISNISLLFLLVLILVGIDIGNHFFKSALVLLLNSIIFVLCLKNSTCLIDYQFLNVLLFYFYY